MSPDKTDHRIIDQRATSALLELLEEQRQPLPTLDEVAARLDMPAANLAAIYRDSRELIGHITEAALATLSANCVRRVVEVDPSNPLDQFLALGRAFLEWALADQQRFRVITRARYVDVADDPDIMRHVHAMRELLHRTLVRAQDQGQVPAEVDIDLLILSGRSFAYGLARLVVDGRLAEFYPGGEPAEVAMRAMDSYIRGVHRALDAQPSRSEA